VAAIQISELGGSMVVQLGRHFLEDFYYGRLLALELMGGYVYEVEGVVAGFITFSSDSTRLFHEGLRKHFSLLCWVMARQVLWSPTHLKAIWRSVWFLLEQHREEEGLGVDAEMLSFAVLPAYRTPEFYRATRVRVSHVLFRAALARLQELGVREFKLCTGPTNTVAQNFFRQHGVEVVGPVRRLGKQEVLMRGDLKPVCPVPEPPPSQGSV
jgi:ribosomal protein S18 acetylase RimI-like enzyme